MSVTQKSCRIVTRFALASVPFVAVGLVNLGFGGFS